MIERPEWFTQIGYNLSWREKVVIILAVVLTIACLTAAWVWAVTR